jgi:hypothetical protein
MVVPRDGIYDVIMTPTRVIELISELVSDTDRVEVVVVVKTL